MKRAEPLVASEKTVTLAGLVVTGLVTFAVVVIAASGTSEVADALLMIPILVLISLPILAREAALEEDRRLLWVLLLALVLKLFGAIARHYVAFDVYGGSDATGYHNWGVELSDRFRAGDFNTGLDSLRGTDFIKFFTGIVYAFIGPSRMSGFLVYSWLGFWGLFLFYKAFRLAVPEGQRTSYVWLVFFFPSMLFWSSSIGKEGWMIFTLGIGAYGAARMLSGSTALGLVLTGAGLWLGALVRAHVALMLALGLIAGYIVRRPRKRGRAAVFGRLLGLIVVTLLAFFLLVRTGESLQGDVLSSRGIVSTLRGVSERSAQGGSEFDPIVVRSPSQVPVAVGTVLFRPFITEANNSQSLLAALEASFLLVFTMVRFRWVLAALRSLRRQPYVALALVYTGVFVVAFASFPNFGLLARQRVQLLPFYFVLLSVPVLRKRRVAEAPEKEVRPPPDDRGGRRRVRA